MVLCYTLESDGLVSMEISQTSKMRMADVSVQYIYLQYLISLSYTANTKFLVSNLQLAWVIFCYPNHF